jgi:hypothetical protein
MRGSKSGRARVRSAIAAVGSAGGLGGRVCLSPPGLAGRIRGNGLDDPGQVLTQREYQAGRVEGIDRSDLISNLGGSSPPPNARRSRVLSILSALLRGPHCAGFQES